MSDLHHSTSRITSLPLQQTASTSKARYHRLVAGAFVSDALAVASCLLLAHWIRFETAIVGFGTPSIVPLGLIDYFGHIVVGVVLMMGALTNFRVYSRENLLSFTNTMRGIFKALLIWFLVYLSLTLVLKFNPPISRMFCGIGLCLMFVVLPIWRGILWRVISRENTSVSLRQRALVVGWSRDFSHAVETFRSASDRPFDIVGVITPPDGEFQTPVPSHMPVMGTFDSLEALLQLRVCQTVIVADDAIKSGSLMEIASICEKEMVEFKLVPTCFQVLLSGLHLESVGGIPILGISRLPLHNTLNQFLKRAVDLLGGLVGCLLSAPVIALFGILVERHA